MRHPIGGPKVVLAPRPRATQEGEMSAGLLVLVGALLCFAGAWSARVTVLLAGFGAAWLVADLLGASESVTLVFAAAGALAALAVTILMSKFVLFVTGCVVGTVLGARAWVVLDRGEASWLLGVLFVPTAAVACGFLAQHFNRAFLRWATAFAGAGLMLAGLARLGWDTVEPLWRPDDGSTATVETVAWLVLAFLGHRVQSHGTRQEAGNPAG
jgi:hypothetical protein